MRYEYFCARCGEPFDAVHPLGAAPSTFPCPECRSDSRRVFTTAGFSVRGGTMSVHPASRVRRSMGDEMLKRNRDAADRMRGRTPPVRRVATDYGSGRVVEV